MDRNEIILAIVLIITTLSVFTLALLERIMKEDALTVLVLLLVTGGSWCWMKHKYRDF
jgi:hypothetical protein